MNEATPVKAFRVYVAGASSERKERAVPVMRALRRLGFTITFDWVPEVDKNADENHVLKADVPDTHVRECAVNDIQGVETADYLVLLAPQNASTGAWVELGYALALKKDVLISGDCRRCIFTQLPGVERWDHDIDLVKELARRIGGDPEKVVLK